MSGRADRSRTGARESPGGVAIDRQPPALDPIDASIEAERPPLDRRGAAIDVAAAQHRPGSASIDGHMPPVGPGDPAIGRRPAPLDPVDAPNAADRGCEARVEPWSSSITRRSTGAARRSPRNRPPGQPESAAVHPAPVGAADPGAPLGRPDPEVGALFSVRPPWPWLRAA